MAELMAKYQDLPMDFADASLVAAAEVLGVRRVFTLDGDFHVYRFADGASVEVIP
jgi:predicted nucleic acid-binding protein